MGKTIKRPLFLIKTEKGKNKNTVIISKSTITHTLTCNNVLGADNAKYAGLNLQMDFEEAAILLTKNSDLSTDQSQSILKIHTPPRTINSELENISLLQENTKVKMVITLIIEGAVGI